VIRPLFGLKLEIVPKNNPILFGFDGYTKDLLPEELR
jgi:hypothetical protein